MTISEGDHTADYPVARAARNWAAPALLLIGLAAALAVRVVIGAGLLHQDNGPSNGPAWTADGIPGVAGSMSGGLAFAACLAAICLASGARIERPTPRRVLLGLFAAAVLCVPAAVARVTEVGHQASDGFLVWAAVVALVATAEEVLLRGVLYEAVRAQAGPLAAVLVGAAAFGMLHVPMYGWGALPLDLAVGGWLGILRWWSGGVTAPAVAHVVADWAGFWLR